MPRLGLDAGRTRVASGTAPTGRLARNGSPQSGCQVAGLDKSMSWTPTVRTSEALPLVILSTIGESLLSAEQIHPFVMLGALSGTGSTMAIGRLWNWSARELMRECVPDHRPRLDPRWYGNAGCLMPRPWPHNPERVESEERRHSDAHSQTEDSGRADEELGQPAGDPAKVRPQDGGGHALLDHDGMVTSAARAGNSLLVPSPEARGPQNVLIQQGS